MSKKNESAKTKIKKKDHPSKEPQTMEELLSHLGYQFKVLKKGDQLEGIVKDISSKAVFIDVGAKTEGIVANREFEAARDFISNLKIGDKVLVSVVSPEDRSGQLILSLRKAAVFSAWEKFLKVKEKNEEVEVKVKEISPSGILVEADGLVGFIPFSQIGIGLQKKVNFLRGASLRVKVLEVDQAKNRLIFSEKEVSEKEEIEKVKKVIGKIKIGEVFEGKIEAVFPFGLLVEIKVGGTKIFGLVHISEISWDKVENLNSLFTIGETVKVLVFDKDEEGGKLFFSIKRTIPDPWQEKVEKYSQENLINGKVVRLVSSGAIVELEEGIEGLLPISKIPLDFKITQGQTISCYVEKVDKEKRKIFLGLVLKEKPIGYK